MGRSIAILATIAVPPFESEGSTASSEEFDETLIIPLFDLLSWPSLAYQVLQDSSKSRIGQFSRPYSPRRTTAVSVLGGAKTVIRADSPALMSTTVEFCTKPVSGFRIRYGINADMSESAAMVKPWNVPPINWEGVMVASSTFSEESSDSPRHPLNGARQKSRTRNIAIIALCIYERVCYPFSMLRLFDYSYFQIYIHFQYRVLC